MLKENAEKDKVDLLTRTDLITISYGFTPDSTVSDEGRRCKSSTYAGRVSYAKTKFMSGSEF